MGFLTVPNYFGYLINFQCQHPRHPALNCHQSVLPDQTPLQLDREGIKAREDGERGGGGRLFQTFRSKEAIIRGTAFIRGLFCFGVMVEYDNFI